ncbi:MULTISPECIES: hypothetical protein [Burkholderia]|uniref:DNA-directed RNA polymerase n=3 Tax=Burkholderia TaxID=32008 RepID=A0ABW7L819_9BURK|nr:hypothetical protein [Burkholderia sp. CpTa8-5]
MIKLLELSGMRHIFHCRSIRSCPTAFAFTGYRRRRDGLRVDETRISARLAHEKCIVSMRAIHPGYGFQLAWLSTPDGPACGLRPSMAFR